MIFDAHGDILSDVMEKNEKGIDIFNDYHLPLYKQGEINGSIFINFSDPFSNSQKEYFNKVSDIAIPYFQNHSEVHIVTNNFDKTKFNIILGIEGLNALDDLNDIQALYDIGYRNFGLTWNEKNKFASSCLEEGGLTPLGFDLINYANKNNILIDLAHSSKQTFLDVAKTTKNPLFVSHSAVNSICNNPRNLDDEQLELIKSSNGVVGVFNIRKFLDEDKENVTIDTFISHIDYIVKKIGIDHVCLGLDFCYYLGNSKNSKTKGLETIAQAPNIIKKLQELSYSNEDIEKISSLNLLRVFKQTLEI